MNFFVMLQVWRNTDPIHMQSYQLKISSAIYVVPSSRPEFHKILRNLSLRYAISLTQYWLNNALLYIILSGENLVPNM